MKLLALIYFVLSLFGLDIGGSRYVTRTTTMDGADTLYSQAEARAGVARFECLRSASGACHYTVYPRNCAPLSGSGLALRWGPCKSAPVQRFTVSSGGSRQISGLAGFDLCVSAADGSPEMCNAPGR
ncbi:hypothetical protein INQ40_01360 [Lysobacter sp. H21R4]|uniref:hypothetical protein n=1 Tax=Lysobacter sp. H21R4 TaxID=2781021 RepID=UPI001886C881|nr:hypothetical protein [Lysobacter sp. H21R4]QOY62979.1 hypothetical protein INQ40_01360 [Lysobacter sp. H21R4]